MVTVVRSAWAVAVLSAVQDRLSQPDPGPAAAGSSSVAAGAGADQPPSRPQRPAAVQLHELWLSGSGSLDVLHVVYEHSGFPEPLEYRVEMDLRVDDGLGPRALARAAHEEARQIVEEIMWAADSSGPALPAGTVRRLCWGAV